jgi:hypothetical protein
MTKPEEAEATQSVMTELSISYNGRQYQYAAFRYDQLADAIAYARQHPEEAQAADGASAQASLAPDATARELMAALDITYVDGVYRLGEFRYDRLADAVNYARLRRMHQAR